MKFMKKKNLQEGEFIIYVPQVHAIKIISPILLFGVIFLLLLAEIFIDFSSRLPMAFSFGLIVSIMIYFLLLFLERIKIGYFLTNKLLIILVVLCPLFLIIFLSHNYSNPFIVSCNIFSFYLVENLKFVVLTLLVLSAAYSVLQITEYFGEEYFLTNKRLIIKKGYFSNSITDIPIGKLESIAIIQGFWGSILNYGTIRIFGLGGSRSCMITIKKPYALRRKMDMVIEKSKAITVINEEYPEPVEVPKVEEVIQPDIFNYGTIVRQLIKKT